MMKQLTRIACAAVMFSIHGLAAAQGIPPPEQIMAENDEDKNGEITREEAESSGTPLAQFFDQFDSNKDGKITMAELKAFGG
jgi:hypothetical protein